MIFTVKRLLSVFLSLSIICTTVVSIPVSASGAASSTDTDVGVSYQTQVQSYGWQGAVSDGEISGTVGKSKRLEAIKISLTGDDLPDGAKVTYQTQVQTYGWQTAVSDGAVSGTVGKSKRLEAIRITLSGMPGYEVEYKVQVQSYGWQDWRTTENGTDISDAAVAGMVGKSKRLEAIEIKVVKTSDETAAEKSALSAVETAEASKSQDDIDSAEALADEVDVESVKTALTERLDAIDASGSDDDSTDLAVSAVTVKSLKVIAVTFNRAPGNQSAITATVKRNGSSISFTSSWNKSGTIMTLSSPATLAYGNYTVDVTNGSVDLGSNIVNINYQKITTIDIVSDFGAVNPYTKAYALCKLYDQYGNDITCEDIYNELSFECQLGTITFDDGLLTLTAYSDSLGLPDYVSTRVTAKDTTSGALLVKTVNIDRKIDEVGDVTLGLSLNNDEGKILTAGDTTDAFYLPFTAHTSGGSIVTSYDLIKTGLIFTDDDTLALSTSNSCVSAKLVKDPDDSTKAAIEVKYVDNGESCPTETTMVTISAMTWAGAISTTTVALNVS